MIPNQSCWLQGFHSTGKPVLGTQDPRTDKRHSIPKSIRWIDACTDDSGSNVHSPQVDHCTRESGTRIVHNKRDSLARTEVNQDPCNQINWFRILVIWKTKNGDQNGKTLWPRWTRSWRSCSLGHNLAASEEGIRKKTWAQMYTRRLDSLRSARQQQNKIRILLEFSVRIGVCSSDSGALWWCNTSSGMDEQCNNPIQLERIHLSQRLSITQSGLVAGGKESEEGRHTVFFTLLDSFGSDAHEREEPSDDFSRRIKVPYESHWRGDQNAVYWVKIVRCTRLWIAILANEVKCHCCASISATSMHWQSYRRWRRSDHKKHWWNFGRGKVPIWECLFVHRKPKFILMGLCGRH